jgi:hypothetical protein
VYNIVGARLTVRKEKMVGLFGAFQAQKGSCGLAFHPTLFNYNLTKYRSVSLAETGNVLHQPSWSSSLFSRLLSPAGAKRPDTFLRSGLLSIPYTYNVLQ